jgi:hypothetical protein
MSFSGVLVCYERAPSSGLIASHQVKSKKKERKDLKKGDLGSPSPLCALCITLPKFCLNTLQEILTYPILFELLESFMWILAHILRIRIVYYGNWYPRI